MLKTIRAKIIAAFLCLMLLNLASGFWSIYNFYALGTTISMILKDNYQGVLAAENMMKSLERQDNALLIASEGENPETGREVSSTQQLFDYWYENRDNFYYWSNVAGRSSPGQSQEPLRDSIQRAYQHYTSTCDSMRARVEQGAFAEAKQYYYEVVRPHSDKLRVLCFRLFESNEAIMYEAMPKAHTIANQTAYGTMMMAAIAMILSVVAIVWLTRVFILPAETLTERVKQIGAGKLDLKIDVLSDDEIGQLSREFNKMTERLKQFEQMNIEKILSEKRKSEAIVENISDGLIMTDAALAIVHVNPVVAELFGLDMMEVIGKPLEDILHDERILKLFRAGAGQDTQGPDQRPQYLEFERPAGRLFFKPRITGIGDDAGSLFGILLVLQDVTQFRELDRMKSDFIATLSHEFKTPLTSINMSVDILNQGILGSLNERQKEIIDSAREDCYRLTKLSRELLQLSKLESGKLELRNEELDVPALLQFSLRPLQLQVSEKGLTLDVQVQSGLPRLLADEQQISWVIGNLVTNAVKNTDPGGRITVRAAREGESILIEVEDNGHGIPPEHLEKIFDKFVQVKHRSEQTPGSVGLGLAIAKEIVEMYGGRIWVRSVPDQGSTFAFTLPLVTAAQHA